MRLRNALRSYANFGEFLYDSNERNKMDGVHASDAYQRINCMRKSIKQTYITLFAIIVAVCLSAMIFSLFPAYMWFIKKNYVWLLPILIPFTQLDTISEFYLNISAQFIFSSSAIVSATCMDLFFALCICHHGTASRLIIQTLFELNSMWKKRKNVKTYIYVLRKAKLINILRQFQDLNK